jgi:hypothetical protein
VRVTYKPQPGPSPERAPRNDDDRTWDWTPTIDVYVPRGGLPNPIGFAPWPKASKAKAARKRRKAR